MITVCQCSGCATLTLGTLCMSCEQELGARPPESFVRGRPYEAPTEATSSTPKGAGAER